MDEEDGKRYEQHIEELRHNQKNMKIILKNQVTLLENGTTQFEENAKILLRTQKQLTNLLETNRLKIDEIGAYYTSWRC